MARELLILFLLLSWCVFSRCIDFKIPNVTPEDCQQNQYFQFSSLRCVNCEASGQKPSEDLLSCVCQTGYKLLYDKGGPSITCENCVGGGSSNATTSLDGSFCIVCPNDVGFNAQSGTCNNCPENRFPVDRERNGVQLKIRQCLSCEESTRTGPSYEEACQRCHWSFLNSNDSSCLSCIDDGFDISGGVCFESANLLSVTSFPNLFKVKYGDKEIESTYFEENLRAAEALCKHHSNFTACQLLGNLCVLLDYMVQTGLGEACKLYNDLVTSKAPTGLVNGINSDWPVVMPWLYYQKSVSNAPEVLDKTDITQQFNSNTDLSFIFAVFTLNGSFVGYEMGLDILHFCQDRPSKMAAASKFATTYRSSCSVAVKELLKNSMFFYDMYLIVGENLYPVPLLVENYRDGGEAVNEGSERGKWKLTRRFYLVESTVGMSVNNKWIRYAEQIELNIRMRSTDGEIFPPMLRVRYKALDVSDDGILNGNQEVSFAVLYEMDNTKITKDTEIAVGCLSALAAILALVKVTSWRRREGKLEFDGFTIIKFILFCFGTFSVVLFWIAFGMSFQWLVFFKQQKTVTLLLPSESQEKLFFTLFYVTFSFKLLEVVHMLLTQTFFDIFFIDWERPQGRVNQPAQGGGTGATDAPVSIWRTLFIANEWNEIQTIRKTNPELQVFLVLFFLKVVGFEYLATTDPFARYTANFETDYIGNFSQVLRFAVLCIVFLSIEAVQWFFFAFIYERFFGDALGDFIDLCAMSNVSIFILENNRYGYYIHGRSVHGRADTNMWQMNEQVKREEDDLCGKRGLEPNSELQTFEIEVPLRFREQYEDVVRPLLQEGLQQQRRNIPNSMGQDGRTTNLPAAVEKRILAYNTLNRFLSAFIDHSLRDLDYLVRDKLLFEHILNMELKELPPPDKAIFYNDNGRSFNSILLYGNEWTLMLFDLLVFAFVDSFAQDFVLAGIITYIVTKLLIMLRNKFGRKNLTRKTLVDERFLI